MYSLSKNRGQGLAEYALIISLVVVIVIVVLALLGPALVDLYNQGMQGI